MGTTQSSESCGSGDGTEDAQEARDGGMAPDHSGGLEG